MYLPNSLLKVTTMLQTAQQDSRELLTRISGALTEISHNIHLVRPSWPEGKFSIWINGFLDMYERARDARQKVTALRLLAEDVECFHRYIKHESAGQWQSHHPFSPQDIELGNILSRITSIMDFMQYQMVDWLAGDATVH